jgi:hypothetical protein
MRFEGGAPIRGDVEQAGRIERIGAQTVLRAWIKRRVDRAFEVEHVVDEYVAPVPATCAAKVPSMIVVGPKPFPNVETA